MLQLGFQDMAFRGRIRPRYEKLAHQSHHDDEDDHQEKGATGPRPRSSDRIRSRCSWVKKMNGRLKGLRLSRQRPRKLMIALKTLPLPVMAVVVVPSKIIRMYADGLCSPNNLIFSSQWGLPVLSHHPYSLKCKRSSTVQCVNDPCKI